MFRFVVRLFKFKDYQALEYSVIKQQVNKKFLARYFDPKLIADKGKPFTQSQNKISDVGNNSLFLILNQERQLNKV